MENRVTSGLSRRGFVGALSGMAAATALSAQQASSIPATRRAGNGSIKITDLKCAIIGRNPTVRIVTDQGIFGYGQAESAKPYLKPMVLFYRDYLIGEDPTDIASIMLKIRRMGAFKPWGAAVSAIEIALWDVAGQFTGLPVYKLLGGKIRDRVRPYGNTENNAPGMDPRMPQDYAELVAKVKEAKEGYTLIKAPVAFHNTAMLTAVPGSWYGRQWERPGLYEDRGLLTERGFNHVVACVEAMKKVLGDEVGLALDCGPGWVVKDAIRFARALEPMHITWLEDLITGDYTPYPNAQVFKQVTDSTSTPIHTGEEIYLRENCKDLIETQAVNVIGVDPEDVGGIAELKWIAEYANLHGILIAPHGIFDGLFGVAAQVQMGATLPQNYIAFEYAKGQPEWWYDIVEGLPDPIVKNGFIDVWDKPGLGITFNVRAAKARLKDEDKDFFD
ncbi:MAG TPA: mandelate racemase/muconate lactonizing enzyme family protein [Terracidiphilus sp.]|nr:mandelate racemase/muconate lactonizing enzyme family protein [Terracidiphilus sp.]